jgi:hypothetical protein
MRDLAAIIGVLASLCLIAVSATLNYRMGYRAADNPQDGMVYGLGAGAGDILKALAPMMFLLALKKREWLAAFAAALVFAAGTLYSFTAALGFAAEHRAVRADEAVAAQEAHRAYATSRDQLLARIQLLGPQRSVAEIDAAIEAIYAQPAWEGGRTVATVSNRCQLSKPATRLRCEDIAKLNAEKAKAADAAMTTQQLAHLEQQRPAPGGSQNAQVIALVALSHHLVPLSEELIMAVLAVMLAVFLEVGSGFGLLLATTPWRQTTAPTDTKPTPDLAEFLAATLEPSAGDSVTGQEVLTRYQNWCKGAKAPRLNSQQVCAELVIVAQDLGLRVQGSGPGLVLHHVKLATSGKGRTP